MAFIEHYMSIYDSELSKFRNFCADIFGFIPDEENPNRFWCDETKAIGIEAEKASSSSYIRLSNIYTNSGNRYYTLGVTLADDTHGVYYQMSKDKDVKYMRGSSGSSSTKVARLIFAKSDNGDWCIFTDSYMYHKNGRMFIGTAHDNISANTPFSIFKVPNLAAGGFFPNLYKVYTATLLNIEGTYADFGGDGYRIVNAQCIGSGSDTYADYAFPVADES